MRPHVQFIVYCVGVAAFGLFYAQVKAMFGSGLWFVVTTVAYLLALRVIAGLFQRVFSVQRKD